MMKSIRNCFISTSLAIGLVACGGGTTTPVDPSVTPVVNPGGSLQSLATQVLEQCRRACEFQPDLAMAEQVINAIGIQTAGLIAIASSEICDAVKKFNASPGSVVSVRGIPLKGRRVRRI
jgi:hypothetical protein